MVRNERLHPMLVEKNQVACLGGRAAGRSREVGVAVNTPSILEDSCKFEIGVDAAFSRSKFDRHTVSYGKARGIGSWEKTLGGVQLSLHQGAV